MMAHSSQLDKQENLFVCNICLKKFRKEGFLQRHIRTHNSVERDQINLKVFKCSLCGCFRPANELIHSKTLICTACQALTSTNVISNEVYYSNGWPEKHAAFGVQECPKEQTKDCPANTIVTYPNQGRRRRANGMDPMLKPYQCPECVKKFSHASSLALHRKIHTGDFRYMCEYCDKTFFLNEYYTKHIRVHTKEKPFACTFCGKSFSQSNTLTQHKRIHTGEKPYACEECGKLFSVKDYLNKHMRTHTGEKPYVCHVCKKCYSQQSGLKMHKKSKGHL